MNWSQLVDRVLVPFDTSLIGTAKKLLVEAQEDFILHTRCLERWKWLYLAANAEYVDLPRDFIEAIRIEWKGRKFEAIDINEPHTLHQVDTDYHTGTPYTIFVKGNRLYLVQGTPSAQWMTLWYIYLPNVLTDSATAYRKLIYDTLTAHFLKGETVTGGTSGATGVVELDDNDRKAGTLTLSGITYNSITGTGIAFVDSDPDTITDTGGGFLTAGFAAGQLIRPSGTTNNNIDYTIDTVVAGTITLVSTDEVTAEGAGDTFTIDAVFTDDEVLTGDENGVAAANGTDSTFATAGDDPDIDDSYRKYLVDYAKSIIYEDKGLHNISDRLMNKYLVNRTMVREHFESRITTGPERIQDVW